ncbi:MAG: aldo/keto reductase [Rhodanobacteraceae bacterium]
MASRRNFIIDGSLATAAMALMPFAAGGRDSVSAAPGRGAGPAEPKRFSGTLRRRAIPSSGEEIPVMGLGTSGSFEVGTGAGERAPLREVLARLVAAGASVIDTAPTYGSAESVLGDLIAEAGIRERLFLATKLSGVSGRAEGLAQFEQSLNRLRTDKVELLQVHNLRDTRTQLALARELKQQGKVKYVGLTHYLERAQDEMADAMQALKPDFVQINYSPVTRGAEKRIFPLARDMGIAVMINRAFEDGRLFARVKGRAVPVWAHEVGADSWAQLFLKFVLSQPAVTVVIPATSKPRNETDNLNGGVGALLDQRQRAALIAALS